MKVNPEKCIGCGACVSVAPEIFTMGGDGKSTLIKQPETPEEISQFKTGQSVCPTTAIED